MIAKDSLFVPVIVLPAIEQFLSFYRYISMMDDNEIQEKINYEIKMREGTVKLLEACHEQSQALEGAKNLLTINARILALMSLLQRNRKKTISSKTKADHIKLQWYVALLYKLLILQGVNPALPELSLW